jgi:hypothetical protein
MRPERHTRREYVLAFRELAARIAASLKDVPRRALPIRMYVAGGAALHFHTGERVSVDVDAVFSRRIALPDGLDVAYRDEDGAARLLYFDRQYNDTLGLMHEDAHDDSIPLTLDGIDQGVLDVRILTPIDLAVSKIDDSRNRIARTSPPWHDAAWSTRPSSKSAHCKRLKSMLATRSGCAATSRAPSRSSPRTVRRRDHSPGHIIEEIARPASGNLLVPRF